MNALSRGIGSIVVRGMTGPARSTGPAVDPGRFGIDLEDPACADRAGRILTAFFEGFDCGLKTPSQLNLVSDRTHRLFRPFLHEGFAMGCVPNGYLRLTSARTSVERFERALSESDPFVFLKYVGLGFWLGFQGARSPARVDAMASGLKARKFSALVHDGYGFKLGFFGHERLAHGDFSVVDSLRGLAGFGFASALNGLGRSLWFFTMDRPASAFELARKLGKDGFQVLGGLGLASAFTFPDQLWRAYAALDSLPPAERPHFLKGVRIALYVRNRCDSELIHEHLDRLSPDLRARAERDLERALRVEARTGHKDDFIEAFHAGCLEP